MINVHFDPAGNIRQVDNGDPIAVPGCDLIQVELEDSQALLVNNKKFKVALPGRLLVERSQAEQFELNKPARYEVDGAIMRELAATDKFVLPDRDDINEEDRAAWVAYRKALRDLSKGSPTPTASEMIQGWPLAPTGDDAAADLRSRLEGS